MDQTTPISPLPEKVVYDITSYIHGMHPRPSCYGGQSDVYAAFWASLGGYTSVAIKVLRVAGIPDAKIRKRLDREISLWGRLEHPNVQPLLGICFGLSSLPAMVSEWQNNGDITSYLKAKSHDPELQSIKYDLLIDVLHGAEYLHTHNIVHGDIKGANVLISSDGTARLSDFGFSTISIEQSRSLSQQSAAKGTTRWMAPEFFDEDDRLAVHTRASDVWALGCLIIEVQTGDLPYRTKRSNHTVILAISKGEAPALHSFEPDALWQLMLRCCQVEPSARYLTPQVLSSLRIACLRSHLHDQHDLGLSDLNPPLCRNEALLDILHHLQSCTISHSSLEPIVGEVLAIIVVSKPHWAEGDIVELIEDSACELLAACVDLAQQPPTSVTIEFLVNTVPRLLHIVKDCPRGTPTYSSQKLRPFAKILSGHGDASIAPVLMRFYAAAPGYFQLSSAATGSPPLLEDEFYQTAWSGDATLFAVASGASIAISRPGKAPHIRFTTGLSSIRCIAMSLDGQRIACGSVSGLKVEVSLWDISSHSALDIGITPVGVMNTRDLVFSQDGLSLVSIHDTSDWSCAYAYVWRVGKTPVQHVLSGPGAKWTSAFTAESHLILAETGYPIAPVSLSLYDPDTIDLVTVSEIDIAAARHYYWFRWFRIQGPYLMLATLRPATLYLYTLPGRLVCSLKAGGSGESLQCVACSPDGAYAAAGTWKGFVYVWNVETEMLLENSPLPVHRDGIEDLTFSSDGTKIITITRKGDVCISDIRGPWLRWDI